MKANFFIVGAAKSGTSSLHSYLGQHPDVCVSDPKEPRFFDGDYQRGPGYYRESCYGHWRGESAVGEATPHSMYLPFVGPRIAEYNRNARILAILRDPVARAHSHWWMERAYGRESLSFPDAIRVSLSELDTEPPYSDPEAPERWRSFLDHYFEQRTLDTRVGYVAQGHYAEQLRSYRRLFGPERVRVILLRDLSADPARTVRDAWEFLDVDPEMELAPLEVRNPATSRPARRVADLARRLGLADVVPSAVKDRVQRMLSGVGRRPPIESATAALLREHYREANRGLEEFVERLPETWAKAE